MQLKNLLSDLQNITGSGMQKTAAENPLPDVSSAQNELVSALNSALSGVEKRASVKGKSPDVTDALTKLATDLASADQEALQKEAELFGACFANGAIAQWARYGETLPGTKTAAAQDTSNNFEKWAAENPEQFQAAFNQGFVDGTEVIKTAQAAELEKLASTPEGQEAIDSFNQGYEKTAAELQKLAATPEGREKVAAFQQGYDDTVTELQKIASEPNGQEKLAAIRQGYTDGTAMIEKLASDYYTRGYNNMNVLLQSM
jgi:hypothetical protein